ncbi:hypothetical protein EC912_11059 [Luteibacter rhizovicinus]|uniref:DUF2314 domain-containing protein n=1 Tax=Luteibacter rhizovicinus TaxID=242606 RepID=A0A4V2W3E5_9GAMM|nr:DUF2314 domain-containing protein [Luteibacter rhizovicinus]TCV91629.1 hypothetical protein EC912_11059 [Luteibacter rhizovicinus]
MSAPRLTTLEHDGWMVDDGEIAHAESPDKFWIPPLAERESMKPRNLVKLRFYIRVETDDGELIDEGERMWVKVTGKVDQWYRGELDNQPYCTDEIKPGLEVWFQARHIIDIHPELAEISHA